MKRRIFSIIGILAALLIALPAQAALFQQGDNLSIAVPVNNNLYAAGGTVSVQSPIQGDLVVAGGTIRIEGNIGNTLQAAGGQVTVAAPVRNSARLAGGTVIITQSIGGDLIVFGGQVSVESGAIITGDVVTFGGSVTMNGKVRGSLKAFGGQIVLGGIVDGPIDINAETATVTATVGGEATLAVNALTIGGNAAFMKSVRYWTEGGQADFGSSLKAGAGSATFDATLKRTTETQAYETAKWTSAGIIAFFSMYSLLSSALLLILFLLLGRTAFKHAGDRLRQAPWWSLLIGFLYFAITPIFVLLLFVTIIGIPVAFFVLALYIFSYVFGTVITAILFTRWIEVWNHKHWNLGMFFLISLLVLLGLKLLLLIPLLGWTIRAVLLFMAFGALISAGTAYWKRVSPYHP